MTASNQPHYVYRCYDATDRLLYIGCTQDVDARMAVHASSWGNPASAALSMRMVRHTVEEHPDKATARTAEREAIYNEAPVLNLIHQREHLTAAQRRDVIAEYLAASRPAPNPEIVAALDEIAAKFAEGVSA